MKQFAIAINSEKEYNKVKKYAEKWGYKLLDGRVFKDGHEYMLVYGIEFNPCHMVFDTTRIVDNWRKAIRKHSPLKLENICVRVDTAELVKKVWRVINRPGNFVGENTYERMSKGMYSEQYPFIVFYQKEFGGVSLNEAERRYTEITPKQLSQMLELRGNKPTEHPAQEVHESVVEKIQSLEKRIVELEKSDTKDVLNAVLAEIGKINERIDKLAKNYKILDTDKFDRFVIRKDLKESNSKLRKRIYDIENYIHKSINPILAESVKYNTPKTLTDKYIKPIINNCGEPIIETSGLVLPKIAIRVENEQEFNDLMKIYDVFGWKWQDGSEVNKYFKPEHKVHHYPLFITLNDRFHNTNGSEFEYKTIIPFSQIKNLK